MAIVTLGIDLAKNVFALHGVDATGKPALARPSVPRGKLLELVASLAPGLVKRRMPPRFAQPPGLARQVKT